MSSRITAAFLRAFPFHAMCHHSEQTDIGNIKVHKSPNQYSLTCLFCDW